ncbi:hypothetical protein [Amycolatopsis sp. NPDC059657]|uniref:hypothetical protein n=1 Tax=Amycolatopsis sp. NPDC059657 TaxID=3346899 RepID=UPI00366FEBEF
MARDFEVKVEGLKELRTAIRRAKDDDLRKELAQAHKDTADVVARPASAAAPHRSGRLARTVKPSASVKGAIVRAGRGASVPYAGPIHFGWRKRHIRANPFLFRTAGKKRDEYTEVFRDRITRLVRRALGS